jgi:hypothetical protein
MSMSRKKLSPIEQFIALPDSEKDRIAAEFDRAFVADTFQPLTPEERRFWQRARRRGRPRVGKGSQRITVSIERSLLKQIDSHARAQRLSRSEFLARSAQAAMEKVHRGRKAG